MIPKFLSETQLKVLRTGLASRVDLENVSTPVGRHCHLDASVRLSGHEIRDRHAVQGYRVDRRSARKGVPYHDVLDPT